MKRAVMTAAALTLTPCLGAIPVLASPEAETVHVVKPGETLNGVANRAGVSASAIAKANDLQKPYVVKAGEKLSIPRAAPIKSAKNVTAGGKSAAAPSKLSPSTPATPKPAASPEEESVHLVRAGETLGGIATQAKVPRVLIIEANGLQPPFAVKAGQKLQIPRTRHYTVSAGDTGFSVSMKYGVPWEQIALANGIDGAAPIKPGQNLLIPTLLNPPSPSASAAGPAAAPDSKPTPAPVKAARFAWPVSGPVRRAFATDGDYHDGIDITAPEGTMVRAAAAGTVKFAGAEKDQFGNLVVLDHGDGWFTAYGFLSRITVKEGAKVAMGERIGLVGDTGKTKGNELHFEIRREGKPVDPMDELPKP